jgi:hypothetical protein
MNLTAGTASLPKLWNEKLIIADDDGQGMPTTRLARARRDFG